MNHLLDADLDPHHEASTGDREISLGMATILGIFFALALICAVFFGFGYTLGRKSAQTAASAAPPSSSPSIILKPAAGSATAQPATLRTTAPAPPSDPVAVTLPLPSPKTALAPADTMIAGDKPPTSQQPATSPTGAFMVQIAAVSSPDIADIEVTALKKYGYDVVIRHEPQDQLLHVQIGPYATRKDAQAMQQNILAHGFNAIVK
jgi:DedD protein